MMERSSEYVALVFEVRMAAEVVEGEMALVRDALAAFSQEIEAKELLRLNVLDKLSAGWFRNEDGKAAFSLNLTFVAARPEALLIGQTWIVRPLMVSDEGRVVSARFEGDLTVNVGLSVTQELGIEVKGNDLQECLVELLRKAAQLAESSARPAMVEEEEAPKRVPRHLH